MDRGRKAGSAQKVHVLPWRTGLRRARHSDLELLARSLVTESWKGLGDKVYIHTGEAGAVGRGHWLLLVRAYACSQSLALAESPFRCPFCVSQYLFASCLSPPAYHSGGQGVCFGPQTRQGLSTEHTTAHPIPLTYLLPSEAPSAVPTALCDLWSWTLGVGSQLRTQVQGLLSPSRLAV